MQSIAIQKQKFNKRRTRICPVEVLKIATLQYGDLIWNSVPELLKIAILARRIFPINGTALPNTGFTNCNYSGVIRPFLIPGTSVHLTCQIVKESSCLEGSKSEI